MAAYRVISSDSHVAEPADLWTARMEPRFRDRAPQVIHEADGFDWWWCDDQRWHQAGVGAQVGTRIDQPEVLRSRSRYEEARPGGYIPEEHVKDMDLDGVDVSFLYATVGLSLYWVPDTPLLSAALKAYNDWLAEFCSPFPGRLKGVGMINLDDVQEGVKELERCARMGLAGAAITVSLPGGKSYDSPEYEPLWSAAVDLEMPISLHLGTNRPGPGEESRTFDLWSQRRSFHLNSDHWMRICITDMIYGCVFERHPRLQVIAVEHELSWVPYYLDRLEDSYNQRAKGIEGYRFKDGMHPIDFFHRNVSVSFQEDALGVRDRDIIGVENLMWGSDYPHTESTFPRSRQIIEEILADCTEEEKIKIVGGNVARVYGLE